MADSSTARYVLVNNSARVCPQTVLFSKLCHSGGSVWRCLRYKHLWGPHCWVSSLLSLILLHSSQRPFKKPLSLLIFGERSMSRKADVLFSRYAIRGGKCDYDSDRPCIDTRAAVQRDTVQRIDQAR